MGADEDGVADVVRTRGCQVAPRGGHVTPAVTLGTKWSPALCATAINKREWAQKEEEEVLDLVCTKTAVQSEK